MGELVTPFTVTAHLASPAVATSPLLLDGILYYGVGSQMGREAGGCWVDPIDVYASALPLEIVETPAGWWWAASQALPVGTEGKTHTHRRTSPALLADWTSERSLNRATGPDKSLRTPVFYRWQWRTIRWTAVGDPEAVGRLLAHVPAVGARTTQGWGRVISWDIESGGPPLEAYAKDLSLRHLPVGATRPDRRQVSRRNIPLRPPYRNRADAVPCWQARAQRGEG